MAKWQVGQYLVIRGQPQIVGRRFHLKDDVTLRQHRAFWQSRGSRCVHQCGQLVATPLLHDPFNASFVLRAKRPADFIQVIDGSNLGMLEAPQSTPIENSDFFDIRQRVLDLEELVELLLIFDKQETAF